MNQTMNRNDIPDESSVPSRTMNRWRIADGVFKRGREKDGSLEERTPNKIVGQILAFRVFEGTGDKGDYEQLEVDVLTRGGMEYIKVNKNMDKGYWPTQGVGLAKFMCAVEEGKVYVIEPQLAKQDNSYGTRNTFVDVGLWNPAAGRTEGVQTEWDGEKFADIADDVFEALENHPLYKDREAPRAPGEKTEYDLFEETCEAKGFPSYKGNEAAWLKQFNKWCDEREWDQIASIDPADETDEDYWSSFREIVGTSETNPLEAKSAPKKGPGKAAPSRDTANGTTTEADEYDPFALE